MQQLLLNLEPDRTPDLSTFVPGQNMEALALIRQISEGTSPEQFVYIWGDPAVGKTHLLKAAGAKRRAKFLSPSSAPAEFAYSKGTALYLVDDCEKLGEEQQVACFSLFNQIRESGGASMLAAGSDSPPALPLRPDLKSRLAWGLVYQIKALTDEEKIDALEELARHQGFALPKNVLPYLITHCRRDMHSLSRIVEALNRYSLQTKRAITLPLLFDLLQKQQEPLL